MRYSVQGSPQIENNMGNWKFWLSEKDKRVRFTFERHFKGKILFFNELFSVSGVNFFKPKIDSSSPYPKACVPSEFALFWYLLVFRAFEERCPNIQSRKYILPIFYRRSHSLPIHLLFISATMPTAQLTAPIIWRVFETCRAQVLRIFEKCIVFLSTIYSKLPNKTRLVFSRLIIIVTKRELLYLT